MFAGLLAPTIDFRPDITAAPFIPERLMVQLVRLPVID
jgi:hypothetical protein